MLINKKGGIVALKHCAARIQVDFNSVSIEPHGWYVKPYQGVHMVRIFLRMNSFHKKVSSVLCFNSLLRRGSEIYFCHFLT